MGVIQTFLADLEALVKKAEQEIKTDWMAFESFLKPFLSEVGDVLRSLTESDLITLGSAAATALLAHADEKDIISTLSSTIKGLLPGNIAAGETALTGVASAVLSAAKTKAAADPTQNTNS